MKPYSDALLGELFDQLFPVCRSITGPGLRQSLGLFAEWMPLSFEQVPTGTDIFDWTVPSEWHIHGARLTGPDGRVIVDFADNNLHVVNYAEPVDRHMSLQALQPHLYSLPDLPQAVPYVTSYYRRNWGFCLADDQRQRLSDGDYHVWIDSEFVDGGLDFAHCLVPGESEQEILLSSYLCHPSMANNELSGPLVLLGLYHRIRSWPRRRYSYRFLLNPETIGSLCFLSRHHEHLSKVLAGGLVLTCLGGPSQGLSYKASRQGKGLIDRVVQHVMAHDDSWSCRPFTPEHGSDERQYCSPGFNLPVGNITRTTYGSYPGYHNSLDDKQFMDIAQVVNSIDRIESLLRSVEIGGVFANTKPYGEPHLSKYALYPTENSSKTRSMSADCLEDGRRRLNLVLQVLSHCDGTRCLVELADTLGMPLEQLSPVVETLEHNRLLCAGSACR
ncbi:MAG: DUF4910 domain-containing protein [Gammaproteobacteria bacterium]|nr:DUF4910 domain-containing protein [Gammaproteobacteria bacterium]